MMSHLLEYLARVTSDIVAGAGYWGIFVAMFVESMGIPLPSEVTMPYGGYLVSLGKLGFWPVVIAGTIGNILGSLVFYIIGATGGRVFLKKFGKYILFNEKHLDTADRWFARYGEATVFFGRLLPVVRTYISLPAGISRMPLGKFLFYSTIGVIPWCWLFTYIGIKLGQNWEKIHGIFHYLNYVVLLIVILILLLFWKKGLRKR
jgi:membrane protein DedA with SNARE-associated domain